MPPKNKKRIKWMSPSRPPDIARHGGLFFYCHGSIASEKPGGREPSRQQAAGSTQTSQPTSRPAASPPASQQQASGKPAASQQASKQASQQASEPGSSQCTRI